MSGKFPVKQGVGTYTVGGNKNRLVAYKYIILPRNKSVEWKYKTKRLYYLYDYLHYFLLM